MHSQSTLVDLSDATTHLSLVETFLRIQPQAIIETAPKGKTLVREDEFADHSILLLEGWVGFSKMLPEGETQIIDVMLPGDFALIGTKHAPVAACSVETLSDARYINIRPHQANGPESDMAMLRNLMAGEVVRTQSRTSELLLRLGKGTAASRVAYALLEFFVRLEEIGLAKDACFEFPMTQHKIGEFVGLSNVHVCRTMRRFEREGVISHPTHPTIRLNDIDALCDAAGIDLETFRHGILLQKFT